MDLKDVIPASSAADAAPEIESQETEETIPEGGRTADNVRGELLRKQEKASAETSQMIGALNTQIAELKGMLQGSLTQPKPQTAATPQVDEMTADQLRAYRTQVPEDNLGEFDTIVKDKEREEKLDSKFRSFAEEQRLKQDFEKSADIARERYPDLGRYDSEFHLAVQAELNKYSNDQVLQRPTLLLDVANEVALSQGITKPQARTEVVGLKKTASTGTAPAPEPSEGKAINTPERRAAIAKNLASALPRGKTFDLKEIAEMEEEYAGERDLHLGNTYRGDDGGEGI